MKVNKKIIITFLVGLFIGVGSMSIIFNTAIRKDSEIKVLKTKIEILESLNRSLSIDSTLSKK